MRAELRERAGICIGPGSIDQAYTSDDFIEIEALKIVAEFPIRFVRGLAE